MNGYEEVAQKYLDWWEKYWDTALNQTNKVEDMQQLWSSLLKTYQEAVQDPTKQPWQL